MKPEEIQFSDWARIMIGEVPGSFYIEIIIRVVVMYVMLIIAMRIMGKRMAAQLDRLEMAGLVTLAAAIGVPLQTPERGIIPAVIIAIVVVLIGKLIARLAYSNQKVEEVTHGDVGTLVDDGVMQLKNMETSLVTIERLIAELRSQGFYHLGQLRRVYLEAGGMFTLVVSDAPKPGLSVIPAWDKDFINELQPHHDMQVCSGCGNRREQDEACCTQCGGETWADAVGLDEE